MDLAIKDVQQHMGKFVSTIIGVGLLLSIVLIMNGIYRGNIYEGVWLIENSSADLWVVERNRGGPFNEQSRIPRETYKSVAAISGVALASPFVTFTVQRLFLGRDKQFSIVGYDIFGGLGGPGRILEGRQIQQAHYEMVADIKLGARIGDRVRLGVHDYTVVGLTKGTVDLGGSPLVYLSLPDAQEVLYQQDSEAIRASRAASIQRLERAGFTPDQALKLLPMVSADSGTINAVLVRLNAGTDPATVIRQVQDGLYLNVFTTAEEDGIVMGGRLMSMNMMLGTFRTLLVVVSIVIIALLIYVLTVEKIKSIATLKLIGAPNWVIVRLIMEQSLVLTVTSFAFAYVVVMMTYDKFPRNVFIQPTDTVITFAVMLAGGVLASLLGVWQALRTPPSLALGG